MISIINHVRAHTAKEGAPESESLSNFVLDFAVVVVLELAHAPAANVRHSVSHSNFMCRIIPFHPHRDPLHSAFHVDVRIPLLPTSSRDEGLSVPLQNGTHCAGHKSMHSILDHCDLDLFQFYLFKNETAQIPYGHSPKITHPANAWFKKSCEANSFAIAVSCTIAMAYAALNDEYAGAPCLSRPKLCRWTLFYYLDF